MSVINPANNMQFKSVDSLFGRIRKRLKSFDAVGILDEGDWFYYIKEVIDRLGVGVYDELQAITVVKDYKACLPSDFNYLYAAYKCSITSPLDSVRVHPQTGFVYYIDESHESYERDNDCHGYRCGIKMCGDKITIRHYIQTGIEESNVDVGDLLRLTGTTKGVADCNSPSYTCRSNSEISISGKYIYTNFQEGEIYIKYYGLAIDKESGLPMIPDNSYIEKALEDYIIYRVFEDFFFNGDVPDIDKRLQIARLNSDESFKAALNWVKMPSFQNAINKIRQDRKNLRVYQSLV